MEEKDMKTFVAADIEVKELSETAFGINHPEVPDSQKTAVFDEHGNLTGWKTQYGEASAK